MQQQLRVLVPADTLVWLDLQQHDWWGVLVCTALWGLGCSQDSLSEVSCSVSSEQPQTGSMHTSCDCRAIHCCRSAANFYVFYGWLPAHIVSQWAVKSELTLGGCAKLPSQAGAGGPGRRLCVL